MKRLFYILAGEWDADWNWITVAALLHVGILLVGGAATGNTELFIVEALLLTFILRVWYRGRHSPERIIGRDKAYSWHQHMHSQFCPHCPHNPANQEAQKEEPAPEEPKE